MLKQKNVGFLLLFSCFLLSACGEKEKQATEINVPEINAPQIEAPQIEAPQIEAPQIEAPQIEAPQIEAPRIEAPQIEAPRIEAPQIDVPDLSITSDNKQITIQIPDTVLFDFDKSELKPSAQEVLDKIGEVFKKYEGAKVQINGHTDNVGEEKYNTALSERRANEVKRYLEKNNGKGSLHISTKGYGESQPITPNNTEEDRKKNRRVEIVIEPKM